MENIVIGRYEFPDSTGYQGWIEPKDKTWIIYVNVDGSLVAYMNRDPETGAVV